MMDCSFMATPMTLNLKKLCSDDSPLFDPTMYCQLFGSLMYLVNTKSDICFVVSTFSQYMCELRQIHWVAAKHVLRYLHGTIGYGLRYSAGSDMQLFGYTDSEWAGSMKDQKSASVICCYNQSCVQMSVNPIHHDQTKHVEMRYHYVRDMVQRHVVELQYIPTDEQVADVFTKPLVRGKFKVFQDMLGIVDDVSLVEREC